jgi:hypothetical protein
MVTNKIPVIKVKIIIQYLDFSLKGVFVKFKILEKILIPVIDNITRNENAIFDDLYEEKSKLTGFL